jgi:beta-lactamase regulating signal transducer with metallopeptidase domain
MTKPSFVAPYELTNLSEWIIEFSICGTILLIAVGLLSSLCKRSSASTRHAVWVSGLVMLLLLPFALKLLPRLHVLPRLDKPAVEGATASRGDASSPRQGSQDFFESTPWRRHTEGASVPALPLNSLDPEISDRDQLATIHSQLSSSAAPYDGSSMFKSVIALTWLAGATFCMLRLFASLLWIQYMMQRSRCMRENEMVEQIARSSALSLGLRRQVRVALTDRKIVPMAWGVIYPSVLLPQSSVTREPTDCRAILLHELGHIRRRDPLWHLLTEAAGVFFWFHPLLWYSRCQCAAMREQACDDLVLRLGVPQDTYARCLLKIVAPRRRLAPFCAAGVAMSASSRIEKRIRAIMSHSENRDPLGQRLALLHFGAALGSLLSLCMLRAENPLIASPAWSEQSEKSVQAAVTAQDGPTQPRTVSGRVVDTDGVPISDALLLTITHSTDRKRRLDTYQTDQSGNFELTFPASIPQWDMYLTWIHADGYALQAVMMKHVFTDDAEAENIEIHLRKPDLKHFRFLNPDGSPCDGVLVVPGSMQIHAGKFIDGEFTLNESNVSSELPDELVEIVGRRTDRNGEVRLEAMSGEQFKRVDVRTQIYGTQRFYIGAEPHELRLSDVGEVRGWVLMDSPELVAGTEVWIESSPYQGKAGGFATVSLDENGRFHVPAIVAGGRLQVTMNWDETLPLHPVLKQNFRGEFVAGGVLDLAIRTVPAVKVNGQILTADTREPVVGARAFFNSLSSPLSGVYAITDNQGKFSVRVAPGVAIQQVTTLGDDASFDARYDHPRLGQANIPADIQELDLEPFFLPPKQVVRGRLYDGTPRPIGGATVIFHTVDRMLIRAEAVTDADGRFMTPIPEWATIQGDPQIAKRYRWSILHDDKAEAGYRKQTTTPLNVIRDDADALVLERP